MIRDAGYCSPEPALQGVIMCASTVLRFNESFNTMTTRECMAFIERSRRQIDRLEHLPRSPGEADREELASIRVGLDALEKRVRSYLMNG